MLLLLLIFQKAVAPEEYLQLVAMDDGLQADMPPQSRNNMADLIHRKVRLPEHFGDTP